MATQANRVTEAGDAGSWKYRWRWGALMVAMSITCFPIAAGADSERLEITYPPDGMSFSAGQPITIHWTDGQGSVSVHLIDVDANQVVSIVTPDTENDGTVDWDLPSTLACDRTYTFYVQDAQPTWV